MDPADADNPDDHAAAIARLLRRRLADGPLELAVSGSSMRGLIASGSTVELRAGQSRPRPGEIWAFVGEADTVTVHRVREIRDGLLVGRGSGNPVDDDPVPLSHAVGRVHRAVGPTGPDRGFGRGDRLRARLAFALRRRIRRMLPR